MTRRAPDGGLATAIAIFMLLVVLAGIGVGALAGWAASHWLSWTTSWVIGCLTPPVLITTAMIRFFPEIFTGWLGRNFPSHFHFRIPADFRGRFYLVADAKNGVEAARDGKEYVFDVSPRGLCRVKPFRKLEDAWAEARATRPDGTEAPLQRGGWGSTDGVVIRMWYVGTAQEYENDPDPVTDLAVQVRQREA